MANIQDILGAFLQSGLSGASRQRMGHALGERGLGGQGGLLGQVLSGLTGGSSSGTGGGNVLGDLANIAQDMFQSAGRTAQNTPPAAMGGLGALAGAILGTNQGSSPKNALGGGALAMLAGLAFDALSKRQGAQGTAVYSPAVQSAHSLVNMPLGLRDPATPDEQRELESQAALILKAMINAAKADGQIDQAELQLIVGKLQEQGADQEAQDFVRREISQPFDLQGIIRAVPNPQVAAEVYAASLLAIQVDTQAEKNYLNQLAQGLGLNNHVVQRLHSLLGVVY